MSVIQPANILSADIDLSRINLPELQKMRESFPGHADQDLVRFLLSRNCDYNLSHDMYRRHLEWLENTPKPTKLDCLRCLNRKWMYLHGKDRDNHPLVVVRMARHSVDDRDIEEMKREQLWWFDHVYISLFAYYPHFVLDSCRNA
jgi:hypothetical protein